MRARFFVLSLIFLFAGCLTALATLAPVVRDDAFVIGERTQVEGFGCYSEEYARAIFNLMREDGWTAGAERLEGFTTSPERRHRDRPGDKCATEVFGVVTPVRLVATADVQRGGKTETVHLLEVTYHYFMPRPDKNGKAGDIRFRFFLLTTQEVRAEE